MSLKVDIHKKFKGFELNVQFESGGKPIGILGASGSGKSMTLKSIAGIETPDEGKIELNGRTLFDSARKINLKPQLRRVGYLFQSYALFPHMSVEQNIACSLETSRDAAKKAETIAGLVKRFELEGLEKRFPSQLSGGQQQRVALARILAYEPEVLLLDEPFSALDTYLQEKLQVEMIDLLAEYAGDAIMVTHNRDEVYKMCDELLVVDDGRVLLLGDTKETFQNPKQLQVARLTGCKNFSRAEKAGENTVRALDWGAELTVAGPIPQDLTYIGVRAHDFHPPRPGQAPQNLLPMVVRERIEEPFEWSVLFRPGTCDDPRCEVWWRYAKEANIQTLPKAVSVDPQNVLLLTGTEAPQEA